MHVQPATSAAAAPGQPIRQLAKWAGRTSGGRVGPLMRCRWAAAVAGRRTDRRGVRLVRPVIRPATSVAAAPGNSQSARSKPERLSDQRRRPRSSGSPRLRGRSNHLDHPMRMTPVATKQFSARRPSIPATGEPKTARPNTKWSQVRDAPGSSLGTSAGHRPHWLAIGRRPGGSSGLLTQRDDGPRSRKICESMHTGGRVR